MDKGCQFYMPRLTQLDLSDNGIFEHGGVFDAVAPYPEIYSFTVAFLSTIPQLTVLDMALNDFSLVEEDWFVALFQHTTSLTELGLANTRLTLITAAMLGPFVNLTYLDLHKNSIRTIPDGCFDALTHLTHIILSSNALTVVGRRRSAWTLARGSR
jgi:Leucine-rich repeat (LRR) protein